MTTVTRDNDKKNIYNVTVGRWNEHTPDDESKYEEKRKNELIGPGEYISNKEPRKISENKTMRLYTVPGSPTLLYQQVNINLYILSSLASEFYHMGNEYTS